MKLIKTRLIFLTFCIVFIGINDGIRAQNATEFLSQCIIYKTKTRTCLPLNSTCNGASSMVDSKNYTTCPMLTQFEIDTIINNRLKAQSQELSQISKDTDEKVKAIEKTYDISIKSSTGFGYVAGIFLCFLFITPLLMDLFKLFTLKKAKKIPQAPTKLYYHP